MDRLKIALGEALEALVQMTSAAASPTEARSVFARVAAAQAEFVPQLVWERQDADDSHRYTVLLSGVDATVSLAVTPHTAIPFPLRGAQQWKDSELVRVNGRCVWLQEAVSVLDGIWGEGRILERIVNLALVQRRLETAAIEVSDEELQGAVDDFRRRRGLFSTQDAETWLKERGLELADLESKLEEEVLGAKLREQLVGSEARKRFDMNPAAFDRVSLVAFAVATEADAARLQSEIARDQSFHVVAERELFSKPSERRGAIECLRLARSDVDADTQGITEGAVLSCRLCGTGPYVALVRAVERAIWDEPTREGVEERLFSEWLARERAAAVVEWNWGPRRSGGQ